jgi:hypothetical protein
MVTSDSQLIHLLANVVSPPSARADSGQERCELRRIRATPLSGVLRQRKSKMIRVDGRGRTLRRCQISPVAAARSSYRLARAPPPNRSPRRERPVCGAVDGAAGGEAHGRERGEACEDEGVSLGRPPDGSAGGDRRSHGRQPHLLAKRRVGHGRSCRRVDRQRSAARPAPAAPRGPTSALACRRRRPVPSSRCRPGPRPARRPRRRSTRTPAPGRGGVSAPGRRWSTDRCGRWVLKCCTRSRSTTSTWRGPTIRT